MKKTYILLLLILVTTLSACTPDSNEVDIFLNEKTDELSDIFSVLESAVEQTEYFEYETVEETEAPAEDDEA